MEMQRITFLNEMRCAEFKEEAFNLEGAEASSISKAVSEGSSAEAAPTTGEWTIDYTTVGDVGYNELVMDGPAPGGVKPIRTDSDPEKCILAMVLPGPADNHRMSVTIDDDSSGFSDTVSLSMENGSYQDTLDFYLNNGTAIIFQNDYLFTVNDGAGIGFETYVDTSQDNFHAKLTHSSTETLDLYQFSLLVQSL